MPVITTNGRTVWSVNSSRAIVIAFVVVWWLDIKSIRDGCLYSAFISGSVSPLMSLCFHNECHSRMRASLSLHIVSMSVWMTYNCSSPKSTFSLARYATSVHFKAWYSPTPFCVKEMRHGIIIIQPVFRIEILWKVVLSRVKLRHIIASDIFPPSWKYSALTCGKKCPLKKSRHNGRANPSEGCTQN